MKTRRVSFLCLALAAASIIGAGCNMTGGIDNGDAREERVARAQSMMEQGDCQGAIDELDRLPDLGPRELSMKGWSQLCRAGATMSKIGKALFAYSSTANNLSVVGNLANDLVPANAGTEVSVNAAIATFNSMPDSDTKQVNVAFAHLVRAAAIIARASGDGVRVRRSDISVNPCLGQNCVTAPGVCSAANMSDADANSVVSALNSAASAAGQASSLGAAKDLAQRLGASDNDTANGARCSVFNNMLTN